MKQWLSRLFSESSGVSMMRVMSFICCLAAVAIAIVGLNKAPVDYSGLSLLCSSFLAGAFGGKLSQKKLELNGAKTDTEIDTDPSK